MITLDAGMLARGWLSVATANEKAAGSNRPALWRTVCIQQYTHGLRLSATDSYMLLHAWVPEKDYEYDLEPELDEIPFATAVAIDQYSRGAGLLQYLLTLSKSEDHKGLEVTVHMNVPWQDDDVDPADKQLDGFAALAVRIEYPDNERVQLPVYEGNYPTLAPLLGRKGVRTEGVALAQRMCARLGKAAAPHGELALVRCRFTGRNKPVLVEFGDEPTVRGLAMPCRWDLETDEPELPKGDGPKGLPAAPIVTTSRELEAGS
jgi:hypothetical protein